MNITIYEFTEEDLNSNKRGFFSPGQRKMIEGMASGMTHLQWWNTKIGIIFLFIGTSIILGLNLQNEAARASFFKDPIFLIVLILMILIVFGIFGLGLFLAYLRSAKLSNSKLAMVEGVVDLDKTHSKYGSVYYVKLGDIQFSFSQKVSKIFRDGEKYRIYYCGTPSLRLIMSYEKVL